MNKTIKDIRAPRTWEGKHGPMVSIDLSFADESDGEVTTKPETLARRLEELNKLVGIEADFDLEPGRTPVYQGRNQWKVKGYPGKPQPQGGGFDGGGGKAWKDNSPSIEAQNAVNNAVKLVGILIENAPKGRFSTEAALSYTEELAPRLYELTQRIKGKPQGPVAPAKSWEEVEQRVKASGESNGQGEGPIGSSDPTSEGVEGEVAPPFPSPDHTPALSDSLQALWDMAAERDLTKARVVATLKRAGQPIESWEDVDERQLKSLLNVTGGV